VNWSRERTIYASIFGLALAGLAVDRCLLDAPLSGPGTAAADTVDAAPATPEESAPAAPPGPRLVRVGVGAQVLEARWQHDPSLTDVRTDAFAPPSEWPVAVARLEAPREPVEKPREVVAFDATLTAIFAVNGSSPTALVDGKVLRVGSVHKGFTLEELTSEVATFVQGDQRVELRLRRAEN
jgi:hypothetical protein